MNPTKSGNNAPRENDSRKQSEDVYWSCIFLLLCSSLRIQKHFCANSTFVTFAWFLHGIVFKLPKQYKVNWIRVNIS